MMMKPRQNYTITMMMMMMIYQAELRLSTIITATL